MYKRNSMVAYQQNELISSTELVKKFSDVMKRIREKSVAKIGVLKNNKLEAVVISTQEYEHLKALEELFESQNVLSADLSRYSEKVNVGMNSSISNKTHEEIFEILAKRYAN